MNFGKTQFGMLQALKWSRSKSTITQTKTWKMWLFWAAWFSSTNVKDGAVASQPLYKNFLCQIFGKHSLHTHNLKLGLLAGLSRRHASAAAGVLGVLTQGVHPYTTRVCVRLRAQSTKLLVRMGSSYMCHGMYTCHCHSMLLSSVFFFFKFLFHFW